MRVQHGQSSEVPLCTWPCLYWTVPVRSSNAIPDTAYWEMQEQVSIEYSASQLDFVVAEVNAIATTELDPPMYPKSPEAK